MIKTPHPLKLGGLAIAAVILVVLLLGTESWPMRVALLALGAVGALTAVDLPFPQYHLLGALSVTVFGTAAASYVMAKAMGGNAILAANILAFTTVVGMFGMAIGAGVLRGMGWI